MSIKLAQPFEDFRPQNRDTNLTDTRIFLIQNVGVPWVRIFYWVYPIGSLFWYEISAFPQVGCPNFRVGFWQNGVFADSANRGLPLVSRGRCSRKIARLRRLAAMVAASFPAILRLTQKSLAASDVFAAAEAKTLRSLQRNGCEPACGHRGHCGFAMRFSVPLRVYPTPWAWGL